MTPDEIAQCATLAMALEVSATPKPGNIDREHNYPDTRYEHFLASAIATYPHFAEAARKRKNLGNLLHDAVAESNKWQHGGNTHFGALILLLPLAMAEGNTVKAHEIVKKTTTRSNRTNLLRNTENRTRHIHPDKTQQKNSNTNIKTSSKHHKPDQKRGIRQYTTRNQKIRHPPVIRKDKPWFHRRHNNSRTIPTTTRRLPILTTKTKTPGLSDGINEIIAVTTNPDNTANAAPIGLHKEGNKLQIQIPRKKIPNTEKQRRMDTFRSRKKRPSQNTHNLHTTTTHTRSQKREDPCDKPWEKRSDRSNHPCHTLRTQPQPKTPEPDKLLQPNREDMRKTRRQEGNGDTIRTLQDQIKAKEMMRCYCSSLWYKSKKTIFSSFFMYK